MLEASEYFQVTVAAQYALSQEEIDLILSDEELDSYLFTFGEAQKAITIFSLSRNARSVFQKVFPQQGIKDCNAWRG